jgi:hypothetical protein
MKTTIEVDARRVRITTEGFGFNTQYRTSEMTELWQWHEAVANCIANHHASAMGHLMPCPEPVASNSTESPTQIEVGSKWCYLSNEQPNTVIELDLDEGTVTLESACKTAEHCWNIDEFLRMHKPAPAWMCPTQAPDNDGLLTEAQRAEMIKAVNEGPSAPVEAVDHHPV